MSIRFGEWDCTLKFGKYANGRTAIQLLDAHDGCPIATATVNVVDSPCPDGHVVIKDWSENEGVLAALVAAGIVEDTGEVVPCDFVVGNLCKLLVDPATYDKALI